MNEEQSTTEANMADARPGSADPANPGAPISAMKDSEDSRTATAGRKRDFHEAASYEDTDAYVSDHEPSRKRVKDDGEVSGFAYAEADSIANISSETPVPALADEAALNSRLPAVQGSSVFTMLKEDSNEEQISVASGQTPSNALPSTTWNTGVQSGLRTSFGSKAKGKAVSRAYNGEAEMNETVASPKRLRNRKPKDDMRDPIIDNPDLVSQSKNGQPEVQVQSRSADAVEPFRRLSKKEQKALSKEDRNAYMSALMTQLHTKSVGKSDVLSSENGELHNSSYGNDLAFEKNENENDKDEEEGDEDFYGETELQPLPAPPTISNELLATIGPAPAPPQPFQRLDKAQLKKLKKARRKEYGIASNAHRNSLNRYRRAVREYNTKLGYPNQFLALPSDFKEKPRKLRESFLWKLSPNDHLIYEEVFNAYQMNQRRVQRDEAHSNAAKILQEVKQWPLPSQYKSTMCAIEKGKTWFPVVKPNPPAYQCKGRTFSISVITDDQGLPIALQDMSFDKFALPFLSRNKDKWEDLDQRKLKGAFNQYLSFYYYFVIADYPEFRQTAESHDAIKIEDAKEIVRQLESANPPVTPAPLPTVHSDIIDEVPSKQESVSAVPTFSVSENTDMPQVEQTIAKVAPQAKLDTVMTGVPSSQLIQNTPTLTFAALDDDDIRVTLRFLQDKYYPSARDEIRCLTCAQLGHMSDSCPELSCMTCGIQGKHSAVMCPREMPCGRCRSRDHSIDDCPERLAMPRSEMTCDLCGAGNHMETQCHRIWRSYEPPNEVIRVSGIPVYCYSCGDADHYGPSCGLYQGAGVHDAEYTFTGPNLFKYLDRNSRRQAISAPIDYSIPPRPNSKGYNIKGKGKANDPIALDESDEEEFIRPSVLSGNIPRGNITFANRGQPPQAPFRSGQNGQNQMTVSIRGGRNTRGGGGGGGRGGGRGGRKANTMPAPHPDQENKTKTRAARRRGKAARTGEAPGRH